MISSTKKTESHLSKIDFVNKTSRDKDGGCANEKLVRSNRIPSEITLGRNYLSVGYSTIIFV